MTIRQHALAKCAMVLGIMAVVGLSGPTVPSSAQMQELETFIRARIEIGESMTQYMRDLGGRERSAPPSMERMRRMEEEINAMVARILKSYGLTIENYRERSPAVFADEAVVNKFLEAHPDLKERYEVLPLHQARERRGAP